jgi:hypothetical protein
VKTQPTEKGKMFANHISGEGWIPAYTKNSQGQAWWHTSVILGTWKAEIGGSWFEASLGKKKKLVRSYLKQ